MDALALDPVVALLVGVAHPALHRLGKGLALGADRAPSEVTLIGVSKRQPAERIALAVAAGLRHLGENYVQELREKRAEVEARITPEQAQSLRWHMIGGLQRNKARAIVALVVSVDSLDRMSLAAELDRRAGQAGRVLDVCIQVNLSGEAQKGGVAADASAELRELSMGMSGDFEVAIEEGATHVRVGTALFGPRAD